MEGGVADFTRLLGEELVIQGAQVHVLTSLAAQGGPPDSPVTCHALMRTWTWSALHRAIKNFRTRVRPQVINVQYQTAAYGMHPAINFLPVFAGDIPVVVTFHDLRVPYLFPKAGPLRRWVNLFLARRASAVVVTNAPDQKELGIEGNLPPIHSIPIGSNVPYCLPDGFDRGGWRRRWSLLEGSVVLSYFGFLNASKGGEDLIASLARLVERGCDARLLMIGGALGASDPTNRAYLAQVRDLIDGFGLGDRVAWTGYLEPQDVSACFKCSDLCVLPYRDGLSIRRGSLMAALAHAMPIISTHPEVMEEGLVPGENIWLVPRRDPDAIAEACLLLARDPGLRERLSRGARQLSARYAWPEIAARTLEVYHAVAAIQ